MDHGEPSESRCCHLFSPWRTPIVPLEARRVPCTSCLQHTPVFARSAQPPSTTSTKLRREAEWETHRDSQLTINVTYGLFNDYLYEVSRCGVAALLRVFSFELDPHAFSNKHTALSPVVPWSSCPDGCFLPFACLPAFLTNSDSSRLPPSSAHAAGRVGFVSTRSQPRWAKGLASAFGNGESGKVSLPAPCPRHRKH